MCGIVGYVGEKDSTNILVGGLKKLEYRGYDSAGLAIMTGSKISLTREVGNLSHLEGAIAKDFPHGKLGIGHTRWATHGRPTKENAHPHTDCKGRISMVHNGIIENFIDLKEGLIERGHVFKSETDTEVIPHLIEELYDGDLYEAVRLAIKKLEGSFAIAVICEDHPGEIIIARKDSPLIVGLGSGEYFIASDIPAVLSHTKDIYIIGDHEMAKVTKGAITVTDFEASPIEKEIMKVAWDEKAAERGGFEDFMLKEIFEQPGAIKETLRGKLKASSGISLDDLDLSKKELAGFNKVVILACGTSYHAGLIAKKAIEKWVKIPVEVDISSEFRYSDPFLDNGALVIAITQSGETADTLAGIREARRKGAKVIGVTNVLGSTITREADSSLYTHAGPEIGVAATKTFVCQIAVLFALALYMAEARGALSLDEILSIQAEMEKIPVWVEEILGDKGHVEEVAKKFASCDDFLFLGRGVGLPVALEGALKLKEISYIHAEGYAAGEMKHGPIALIDEGVPVVVVATVSEVYEKTLGNVQEVKARGAEVIAIASKGNDEVKKVVDHVFYVPEASEIISAILGVIPLQLLSYYIAKARGCNVDQPRNLAKSVTVE
ncbi:MAG: glutamine--fructose-6-phosphate transaminase (isomerizing) [Actinomycetota bacterium]|nr:glutamine--fructose-6-phosphate transaminase (isomerizing) [Actinomycetota bacterium]